MFGISKKLAASMAELLIILAIVGILSVLYRKTVNEDAMAVKYGYKTLINNMLNFASTQTNSYEQKFGVAPVCDSMFRMVNTLGGRNCEYSVIPLVPNFTTTSGLRFFGLEQNFHNYDGMGEKSIFLQVDLDGLLGQNRFEEDIFPFELMQSGRIRPAGSSKKLKNNIARDPEILAINASYVPAGETLRAMFLTIGNRISFAEAQCLSGNIFPYRDAYPPHTLQMCVEDATVRNAINKFNPSLDSTTRDSITIADKNGDGSISTVDRDEIIREYRLRQAQLAGTNVNSLCSAIYTNDRGVAKGITPTAALGKTRCGYCYKIAYARDYCSTEAQRANPTRCPVAIINATESETGTLRKIIDGMCSVPQWIEQVQ